MANQNLAYNLTLKDFFNKTMLGVQKSVDTLDGKMNRLGKTVNAFKNLFLGGMVGGAIVGFGKSVIDALTNYEYFSASIRVLMFGDALAAKSLEKQLVELASTTPFSLSDVQSGSKQLLAYGFKAGNVTKDLKMLGSIASGVAAPLNDIVYLYGTLKTQGRAYSKDIMQFTGRGIPIVGELAKQFKVAEKDIKGMIEEGKIGFPQIEKAFKSMTSEGGQFFQMMDVQSKTVGGRISNLGDSWEQLKVNIGKSQTGIVNSTVDFLNKMTTALSNYWANSNQMYENFKKGGGLQFTAADKVNHEALGLLTGYNYGNPVIQEQENFQSAMSVYTKPKNLQEAYGDKAKLYAHSIGEDEELRKGLIDDTQAKRFQSTIKGALDLVEGSIRLFKSSGNQSVLGESDTKPGEAIGSPIDVTGARPQNITINVNDGLVHEMNIYAETMEGGTKQAASMTKKEFLELLNDANQIANR